MAARPTGWAMLCAASPQEAADFALVAHASTLESRVPFLHFFDGFRTSHEIGRVELPDDDDDHEAGRRRLGRVASTAGPRPRPSGAARQRARTPTSSSKRVRRAIPTCSRCPASSSGAFARLGDATGRHYGLVEYHGALDAERVVVLMGSGAGAATEAIDALDRSRRTGRNAPSSPVPAVPDRAVRRRASRDARAPLPCSTARRNPVRPVSRSTRCRRRARRGVADRAVDAARPRRPLRARLEGVHARDGRRPCSTPRPRPTVPLHLGIVDDVTRHSLAHDDDFRTDTAACVRCSTASVPTGPSAPTSRPPRSSVTAPPLNVQAYFVYDSKKSGSTTVSHLRFDEAPIRSTYLSSTPTSSRATSSACSIASTCSRSRSRVRPSCSTVRTPSTPRGIGYRARCKSRSSPSVSTST